MYGWLGPMWGVLVEVKILQMLRCMVALETVVYQECYVSLLVVVSSFFHGRAGL